MSTHPTAALLRRNLDGLRARIGAAQARGPHAADAVRLLPVTKSAPTWLFEPLAAAGVTAIGENRVQAASERRIGAPPQWVWHGIGHLQRNKAKAAVRAFDTFHALDSWRLAQRLEAALAEIERVWPVYVQVNAAHDAAKGGLEPEAVPAFLDRLTDLPHLEIVGFMTMGKRGASEDDARATFRTLRDVRDEAVRRGTGETRPSGLSMGMSDDFGLAVEEGATIVRVGRAVFAGVSMEAAGARMPTKDTPEDGVDTPEDGVDMPEGRTRKEERA